MDMVLFVWMCGILQSAARDKNSFPGRNRSLSMLRWTFINYFINSVCYIGSSCVLIWLRFCQIPRCSPRIELVWWPIQKGTRRVMRGVFSCGCWIVIAPVSTFAHEVILGPSPLLRLGEMSWSYLLRRVNFSHCEVVCFSCLDSFGLQFISFHFLSAWFLSSSCSLWGLFCTACRHLLPYSSPFKSLFQKYVNFKSENLKHPSRERELIFCFEDVGFRFRFCWLLDWYIFSVWISGRMDVLFEKW